ncbi:MAG: hypothetical protein KHY83_04725, partial [Coriobacteriia bacterium]|nr:hypothetical protein [Coriobacteriia bacterium]
MRKTTIVRRTLGGAFALALACCAVVPALADEGAAGSAADTAAASQQGWSDEAKELAAEDTRMGNTIGYNGGVDYWG